MVLMKSPATPLLLITIVLYVIVRSIVELTLFISPYIQRLAIATLKLTKTLLQVAFVATARWGVRVKDYFYPVTEENALDVFLGVLMSDIGRAIAYMGRVGGRICE